MLKEKNLLNFNSNIARDFRGFFWWAFFLHYQLIQRSVLPTQKYMIPNVYDFGIKHRSAF